MKQQLPPPSNGADFEDIYLEFCRLNYSNSNPQKVGCSGQEQAGVDIVIPEESIGIQCKKKELWNNGKITEAQLKKVINDAKGFQPPLKQLIVAVTCKRDADIQKIARKISKEHKQDNLFSVRVESWDDIQDHLFGNISKYIGLLGNFWPEIYELSMGMNIERASIERSHQQIANIQMPHSSVSHKELNIIKNLLNSNKPETAFQELKKLKETDWHSCSNSIKYRILTNMGGAQISMGKIAEGCSLLIEAYHYNKEDIYANTNCASAYLLKKDLQNAKKHIDIAKSINPYDEKVYEALIQFNSLKGQYVNQILRSVNIPESIKKKPYIAFYLSQAAINSNEPDEIKKWARIAYDNNDEENHYILSHYASALLIPIQKQLNSFIVKKAVDNYRPDILTAIEVYKKLTSSQEYSEIKRFHPEWYINLSVAYEFLGDIDEAIRFSHEAIREDPENISFKLRLVELLLLYKNAVDEGIQILEKVKDNPKTPIESQIILSEALFIKGDYEKWNDVLDKIMNSKNVSQNIKTEAIRSKIFRLSKLERYEEAEKALQILRKCNPNETALALTLESIIKMGKGNVEEAKSLSLQARTSITKDTHSQDIKLLANEMYKMKLYKECEPLFERVIDNNYYHPAIHYLLDTYYKNGKDDKALKLANILNEKNLYGSYPAGLMSSIYEENGDIKRAIEVCKAFLSKNPDNVEVKLTLSSIYIRSGRISETKEILLNNDFNIENMNYKQIIFLSQYYMEIKEAQKSLDIQYQLIQRERRPETCKAYMALFTYPVKCDKSFLEPKEVAKDCYIKLRMLDGEEQEFILVNKLFGNSGIELLITDELSRKMLSRRIGDTVEIKSSMPRVSGTIIDIKSKYVYMYNKILNNYNTWFPSDQSFIKMSFPVKPTKDNLPEDFIKLHEQRNKQVQTVDELFEVYKHGKVPIGFISKMTKKHPIAVIEFLISSNKYKFVSSKGTVQEYQRASHVIEKADSLLIDLSSLFIIHLIGLEKYISKSNYELYICQSTIDSIQLYIRELSMYSGLTSYMENKEIRFSSTPIESIKEYISFLQKIIKWTARYCKVKTIPYSISISRSEKQKWESMFCKEFCDSVFATSKGDMVLLCEDERLRSAFQIQGGWVFVLINILCKKRVINNEEQLLLKAELVKYNQSYISIDSEFLLYLCEKYQYSVDVILKRGLEFLGPISESQWAIVTTAQFLISLWRKPIMRFRIEEISKETLSQLVKDRNMSRTLKRLKEIIKTELYLLPFEDRKLNNFIDEYALNYLMDYNKPMFLSLLLKDQPEDYFRK